MPIFTDTLYIGRRKKHGNKGDQPHAEISLFFDKNILYFAGAATMRSIEKDLASDSLFEACK